MTAPTILYPGRFSTQDLSSLKAEKPIWKTIDIYEQQLEELYETEHPDRAKSKDNLEEFKQKKGISDTDGGWIYYPWSGILLHTVDDKALTALRTNRNQPLVNRSEQEKLSKACIGILGMSVGSSMALSLAYSGIASRLKLADFDTLSTCNLNRLREPLSEVGQSKIDLTARHIYEINPFADLYLFDKRVGDDNLEAFFSEPELNLIIDEIDDFKTKVKLRIMAKERKIPLLMFTSLGDNILVDIERYDFNPGIELFNGLINGLSEEILARNDISEEDIKRYAVQIVGQQYVPTRALAALPEIGKSLVGRPQLFSTVAVDGGLAAFIVRQILLGVPVESGRYYVQFAELFGIENDDIRDTPERQAILQRIFSNNGQT